MYLGTPIKSVVQIVMRFSHLRVSIQSSTVESSQGLRLKLERGGGRDGETYGDAIIIYWSGLVLSCL